jgi:UV DNA damage endonuclease
MIRWGLCCIFREVPIKFHRTTAKYTTKFSADERLSYLSNICLHNAASLLEALQFCLHTGIGAFRINSQILPLKTHPELGYAIEDLPQSTEIVNAFKKCKAFCRRHDLRTSFHPDQFILLSSPNPEVTQRSIADLNYQAEVAEWVGADVINIHAGGAYGNKAEALKRLIRQIRGLPQNLRNRLTLENDDRLYTARDLLPVCEKLRIPFEYDLHHHRCLPDGQNVEDTTHRALRTWDREPLFHISSPLNPRQDGNPRNHHDFIDPEDLPEFWLSQDITVEVEAKAKELAVLKLMKEIEKKQHYKSRRLTR